MIAVIAPATEDNELHLVAVGSEGMLAPAPRPELTVKQFRALEVAWIADAEGDHGLARRMIREIEAAFGFGTSPWEGREGPVVGPFCRIGPKRQRSEQPQAKNGQRRRNDDPATPTRDDLKQLDRVEHKVKTALQLSRSHHDRQTQLNDAQKLRQSVQERVDLRSQVAFNASALREDARLEALRGGDVVEDDPREAPGRRRRRTVDGLAFLLDRFDNEGGELHLSVRRSYRRCWVAGQIYRPLFQRGHESDVQSQFAAVASAGGGDQNGTETTCVGKIGRSKSLKMIEEHVGKGPRGPRRLHLLRQVAGKGMSIRSVAHGTNSIHAAKLALLQALELTALALMLP